MKPSVKTNSSHKELNHLSYLRYSTDSTLVLLATNKAEHRPNRRKPLVILKYLNTAKDQVRSIMNELSYSTRLSVLYPLVGRA